MLWIKGRNKDFAKYLFKGRCLADDAICLKPLAIFTKNTITI